MTCTDLKVLWMDAAKDQEFYGTYVEERTGGKITQQRLLEMMQKQTFVYAEEAKELGLVHEILQLAKDYKPDWIFIRLGFFYLPVDFFVGKSG
jgi:ATP-dependent protease ClpP protease subunit